MQQRVYRMAVLATTKNNQGLLPVSPATVWRWVKDGTFPAPEISAPQAFCDVVRAGPPSGQYKLSTFGCFFFWLRIVGTSGDDAPAPV